MHYKFTIHYPQKSGFLLQGYPPLTAWRPWLGLIPHNKEKQRRRSTTQFHEMHGNVQVGKAGLVRYLTIEYTRTHNDKNRRLTTYLSKSLVNMHSLSGEVVAQMIKGLGKILWSVCKILIFSKLMILSLALQ
jgi:hypothetical protein